ncbi:uncharacterized protein LOC111701347 [Eurytemora carolleeae]|uniref:uncharacterized protein LOC111701347 n=1 Tax=Eurytemora carolleeae TaxID=1294199 RepID=UPI000C755E30|nr:uncharacterized protein LOC111701347 [Eurytemora carolleeae]|eukprot:XP_023328364.1 uncharacterized protein LOC111701347 [Eurytemora affinis]
MFCTFFLVLVASPSISSSSVVVLDYQDLLIKRALDQDNSTTSKEEVKLPKLKLPFLVDEKFVMCYSVFAYGSKKETIFETIRPGDFSTGFALAYCTISQCSMYLTLPNSESGKIYSSSIGYVVPPLWITLCEHINTMTGEHMVYVPQLNYNQTYIRVYPQPLKEKIQN